ncbi:MAG: aminotransferase class I/II-fold pyridoxal phosphate-dependent enzyme [Bacilli bacterium]|nr:aminotransferase class I/II-fold pyridoxal phosphate-dependent enzyme [Bacilli bacterium]
MSSVWQSNNLLKKWEKKNQKILVQSDFTYDLGDPLSDPLIEAISKDIGVKKEFIYLGAGSCQLISGIMSIPCWDKVYLSQIEFGLYERAAEIYGKTLLRIKGMHIVDFMKNIKKIKSTEKDLLCISSPRWFTGEMFSENQVMELLKTFKGTIMIDEAYVDYSNNETGMMKLCLENNRIIVTRSYSKKFLASGLRTGYLITTKNIAGLRTTIIPTHSVSSYSANFFIKLLSDDKILKSFYETRQYMKKNRDLIFDEFCKNKKIKVIKSNANFITLIFNSVLDFENVYSVLKDYAGIQRFERECLFIKIWVNNETFSKLLIEKIKEVLK